MCSTRRERRHKNFDFELQNKNLAKNIFRKVFVSKLTFRVNSLCKLQHGCCRLFQKKKLIRGPGCPEPNDRWRARPETRTLSGRIYFPFIRNGTESSRWWSAHQEIRLRRGGKWRRTVACNSIDLFKKLCKAQLSCEMISICKAAPMSIPDECAEIWKQTSTRAPKSSNKLHSKQMFAELFVLWVTLDY